MRRRGILLLLGCLLIGSGCGTEDEYTSVLEEEPFEAVDEKIDPLPVVAPSRRPRVLAIFGTVRDAMGVALSDARIELLERPPVRDEAIDGSDLEVRASTTSAPDGAWRIRAEVSGPVVARATYSGVTLADFRPVPWAGGRLDIRGEVSLTTAIGVFTPAGVPIKEATLAHVVEDADGDHSAVALGQKTAPRGTPISVYGLAAESAELLVRAPGHAITRHAAVVTLADDDSPRAVTLPPEIRIRGRVLRADDEQPVEAARVWIREPRLDGLVEVRTHADPEGRFEAGVSSEPGTVVDILVRAPRYGPTYRRLVVSGDMERETIIRLAPAESVQGRVLDAAGEPVRGATLQWLDGFPHGDWSPEQEGPPRIVQTDEHGRFAIPWPAGEPADDARILLAASQAHGFVTAPVSGPTESRRLRLVLGGATPVRGHVRSFENKAMGGAAVLLERADGTRTWPRAAAALKVHLPLLHRVVAGEHGAFAFPGVPKGRWRISVRYGDQGLVDAAHITVEGRSKIGALDIRFPHGPHQLALRTQARQLLVGPLERAREAGARHLRGFVRLQPARGERGSHWSMRVPLTPDGKVILTGLPDVPHHVQVIADGHLLGSLESVSPARSTVSVPLEPTAGLQIPIQRARSRDPRPEPALMVLRPAPDDFGHDRGRPITLDERPYVEARDGTLLSALALAGRHQRSALLSLSTNVRYVMANVPRGSYDVALFTLDGRVSQVQSVDLPTRTMVTGKAAQLSPAAAFRARVVKLTRSTEVPVAGVRCELRPTRRRVVMARGRYRMRTNADGHVAFERLMPGTYALAIELDDGVVLEQRIEVNPGSDNFLAVVAHPPGALRIHVETTDKTPLAGAHVQILTEHGLQVGPRPTGRTDEEGVFLADRLAPGTYTVIARHEGMASPAKLPRAVVSTGEEEKLWVTMAPAPRRGR